MGIVKILIKDAAELIANPRMLVLSFVVAPLILLVVGQLNVRPAEVKVLMSGLADCTALRAGIQQPHERKGDLGASFVTLPLTAAQNLFFGFKGRLGVIVSAVEPNSAASAAGLMAGDALLQINGAPVASQAQLKQIVAKTNPGSEIALTILRDGHEMMLRATATAEPWFDPPESTAFRYMRELSYVRVDCRPTAERDPFKSVSGQNIDMLLNIADGEERRWAIYIKETNPRRVGRLLELARGIRVARQQVADVKVEALHLYKMSALGAVRLQPALMYYPQSVDNGLGLLPMTFSLITCFLAFIVAAPSLIRERELHMLEILLGAPGIRGMTVLIGKALLPVLVSLFAAMIMLVVVEAVYRLYVKADVELFLLFLVLPCLSSALLGLLVSAVARSQVQTVMAAAIYFFCLLLLSGFLYPAEAGTAAIQIVTRLFSLTYLLDPANAWFFGAEPFNDLPLIPLALQCLAYAALAAIAWRRQLRRI